MKCTSCGKRSKPNFGFNSPPAGNYPYSSDAMGCGPDQIAETAKSLLAAGIPTQFDSEGGVIVESNGHRNQLMQHFGLHDRDAGYSNRTKGEGDPDHFREEIESYGPSESEMFFPGTI